MGTRIRSSPRPLRIALWVGLAILIVFLGYSWIAGYGAFARDQLSGQIIPTKVRFSPFQAIRHIGELFPMFIRSAVPMLAMVLFYMGLLILQFVGLFWYMSRGRTYVIHPGEYDVTFDDVRGQPAVVEATKEVVHLFQGFMDFRSGVGIRPTASCSKVRRAPARRCSARPSPGRARFPSSTPAARRSPTCSSASETCASPTCSARRARCPSATAAR